MSELVKDSTNRIIALMQDLMFLVQIQDTAKRAGFETVAVKTRERCNSRALDDAPQLIVIDLNYSAGEPLEVIRDLKANEKTKNIQLLAFVSHVQADLRAAAVASGCDVVVARSAFAQRLPEIIDELPK